VRRPVSSIALLLVCLDWKSDSFNYRTHLPFDSKVATLPMESIFSTRTRQPRRVEYHVPYGQYILDLKARPPARPAKMDRLSETEALRRIQDAYRWLGGFPLERSNLLVEENLRALQGMKRRHNEVGDMLAYVNDFLVPHGFDVIAKDDFAALRQMLQR
jgi:hypothetical protein